MFHSRNKTKDSFKLCKTQSLSFKEELFKEVNQLKINHRHQIKQAFLLSRSKVRSQHQSEVLVAQLGEIWLTLNRSRNRARLNQEVWHRWEITPSRYLTLPHLRLNPQGSKAQEKALKNNLYQHQAVASTELLLLRPTKRCTQALTWAKVMNANRSLHRRSHSLSWI